MMIKDTATLQREYLKKAQQLELKVDCPCDGVFGAQVAIIAEAPGEREVAMKVPLVGSSGRVLWNELGKYGGGLRRNQVFVTNVVRRQLLKDDRKSGINQHELDAWEHLLRWELIQLPNLKYVLLLGNYALHAITRETGITNWRGSVIRTSIKWIQGSKPGNIDYDSDGIPKGEQTYIREKQVTAICANNPAAIIREPRLEPVFRMDLHKLKRVRDGTYKDHNITAHVDPTPREAIAWCDRMLDERLPIAFDIEVISNETACVGFANRAHVGMCINFRDRESQRWTTADEREVRKAIQRVLLDDGSQLVAQNGNFDAYWLWYKDRIRCRPIWFDTMLAHHLLYPQLPHGLGFLTAQYTDHPFYKDEAKDWREGSDIRTFWEYNVKDVCITRACQARLEQELRDQGVESVFYEHIMRAQPKLVRATVGGVLIDRHKKEKIAVDLSEEVAKMVANLHHLIEESIGEPLLINPRSWKQLQDLFFRRMKLVGRGTSTDATNRQHMRDHHRTRPDQVAVLDAIDKWAVEDKFLSTYANMRIDDDNRIRCEYKQTGVQSAPGRLSSAGVLWGSGANLQNQPERAYDMFIADDGYAFGYFDLSQAEARAVACFAEIYDWLDQFERARIDGSYDCHRALASQMFGVPYDSVPTHDRNDDGSVTIRFIAKRCRHGLNYRMGPPRLAETTGLPLREAEPHYHTYHRITPELRAWWGKTEREVRQSRVLTTPFGRRLIFLSRIDDDALKSIIAFRPQSTIGDKVTQVWYQSEDDERWPHDARIAMNIHDALICLAPLDKMKTCLSIMKHYAEQPLLMNGIEMIIPAECKMSVPDEYGVHRWSNLKGVDIE